MKGAIRDFSTGQERQIYEAVLGVSLRLVSRLCMVVADSPFDN